MRTIWVCTPRAGSSRFQSPLFQSHWSLPQVSFYVYTAGAPESETVNHWRRRPPRVVFAACVALKLLNCDGRFRDTQNTHNASHMTDSRRLVSCSGTVWYLSLTSWWEELAKGRVEMPATTDTSGSVCVVPESQTCCYFFSLFTSKYQTDASIQ